MARILLVIGGGIAAYKSLDLIRRLRERGMGVRAVMTKAAGEFITPLSVGALTNERVFTDLFDLDDEREIGHIRLARDADLVIVAPATADLLARMAVGLANDLATSVLLATRAPVLVAPAMNPSMWLAAATERNVARLMGDGIHFIGPNVGEMAESGEAGPGRMAEPLEIVTAALDVLSAQPRKRDAPRGTTSGSAKQGPDLRGAVLLPLSGRHVLVTSGPTHEPIDPVRYIANRSSGKQGHAIAAAAARLGARVTLVSGPVQLPDPAGVETIHVETAREMLTEVKHALPADIAVFAAAVADWRVVNASTEKIKKGKKRRLPDITFVENPDILKTIAHYGAKRPALVIGFAAETAKVMAYAKKKRKSKGADWIVANDVSPKTKIMGGDMNRVHLITADGVETWDEMPKDEVAEALVVRAAQHLALSQVSV